MIEFRKLEIGYKKALAKITVQQLKKGEVYALIGSNGSGKSTFLKTICGQLKPFSGQLFLDNNDMIHLTRENLAKTISFVPARFPELEFVSVYDFVLLGRTPYLNTVGSISQKDKDLVNQLLEKVKIDHLKTKFTNQISDGERQLCAVARALAQQTSILLLDEPSGYLDYKNKRRLLELLVTIAKELNLLILFSTHDIETIQQFDIQLIGIEANHSEIEGVNNLVPIEKQLPFDELIHRFYN